MKASTHCGRLAVLGAGHRRGGDEVHHFGSDEDLAKTMRVISVEQGSPQKALGRFIDSAK